MIAVLFHGIDIFYDEESKNILKILNGRYDIKPYIVGTMGITSLFDSGVQGVDIILKKPSEALSEIKGFDSVIIILKARSIETARAFLGIIGERTKFDGEIIGVDINTSSLFQVKRGISDIKDFFISIGFKEELIFGGIDVRTEGYCLVRRVKGCNPGELLLFGGIVVGRVTSNEVKVYVKDGKVKEISGADIKNHGLEKITNVDIYKIKIDSTPGFETRDCGVIRKIEGEDILFINHDAYSIYKNLSNLRGAVTVGDDTTRVSGYILKRFGIPLIGIIDGDKDGVIKGECFYSGSILFEVNGDDIAGDRIFLEFFKKSQTIRSDFDKLKKDIEVYLGKDILKKIEY